MNKLIKLIIPLFILFVGCSSVPKAVNFDSGTKLESGHGVVFGNMKPFRENIGRAIVFRNIDNQNDYLLAGAKRFSIKLPAGRYSIAEFGGFSRQIKPKGTNNGLKFDVKEGKAIYVGELDLISIPKEKSCNNLKFKSSPKKVIPHVGFNKGMLAQGDIQEVDWDKHCLLVFDNLKNDFSLSNLKGSALNLSDVVSNVR